jgi:hypothetical protein
MFFAKKNTAAKDEQLASFSNVLELPACQKKKRLSYRELLYADLVGPCGVLHIPNDQVW